MTFIIQNYGLKLHRNGAPANLFEYSIKVKGITLDFQATQSITFESIKERVLSFGSDDDKTEQIVINYNQIRPNASTGKICTIQTSKRYNALITKGIVMDSLVVVPFGYYIN